MQLSLGGPVNLPKIRDDIEIFDGGSNKYSSPTWVIYDPVIEKFYRIGWVEHEIISNWHIGNPEAICQKINQSTTIKISPANIERIVKFLSMHNLLQFDDHEHADKLYDYYAKMRAGRFARFLQQYLFLRLPLLRPDRFLSKTLPYIKFLFSKKILYLIIVIGILGSYFVVRNWSQFVSHYDYFFTFESMAMLFIILAITKMFHELGHAYTAKYYGCSVSTMGVALLVLFPILYTDTTDTWRLKSRRQRILVACAGMMVEFSISAIALFLWAFTPDAFIRNILVYIPTVSLLTTLLININPLLRFDGYHILSDLLSTDNLQTSSFSLATWQFRKTLFGIKDPQPVICNNRDKKIYLTYAYFTWIYRFFLYLSIAVLVYYFFFKVLGVFLMLVEIFYFILLPVYKELKTSTHKLIEAKKMPGRAILTIIILLSLISLLFVPWQNRIEVPAILTYKEETKVYAPHAAKITNVSIKKGDTVDFSDEILKLDSLEISYEIIKVQNELDIINTKIRQEQGLGGVLGEKQVSQQELIDKQTQLANLIEEKDKLDIKAPHRGEVINTSKALKKDIWVDKDDYLLTIANIQSEVITGYIYEQDIERLTREQIDNPKENLKAEFYLKTLDSTPIDVTINRVDTASNDYLDTVYLASLYGGELLVFPNRNRKQMRAREKEDLVLSDSVYKITAMPLDPTIKLPDYSVRGYLYIYGEKRSIMSRVWRYVLSVILRESGV